MSRDVNAELADLAEREALRFAADTNAAMADAKAEKELASQERREHPATERPKLLSMFGRCFQDRPPEPIPVSTTAAHRNSRDRSAFRDMVRQPLRKRPQIGAYELADLDAAFTLCRYPHGDGPFLFCGAPVEHGSYCAEHNAVCLVRRRRA